MKKLSPKHKKIVVIFESIYSADGSVAPMKELFDLCEQYEAITYVDDANGFLIYGPESRPFSKEFSQLHRADFIMVSFSKSVGMEGGAIVGPETAITATLIGLHRPLRQPLPDKPQWPYRIQPYAGKLPVPIPGGRHL